MLFFRKRQHTEDKPAAAAAIDIDHLNEVELLELTKRIFERIKVLAKARSVQGLKQFQIGDRVTFETPRKGTIAGTLIRHNKKTVSIKTDDGRQWNVAPIFLSKVAPPQ